MPIPHVRQPGLDYSINVSNAKPSNAIEVLSWVTVSLVFIYVSNFYDYIYQPKFTTLVKPLYWHILTIGLAGVAVAISSRPVIHRYPVAFLLWSVTYFCLLLVSYLYSSQTDFAMQQLQTGLMSAALLSALVMLLLAVPNVRLILGAILAVAALSICLNLYDFIEPTFTGVPPRAAGLYENPNVSGKILAISMVLCCSIVPKKMRLTFCAAVGIGILVTFSRSSWLMWAIGVTGLALSGTLVVRAKLTSVFVASGAAILAIYALWSGAILDIFYALGIDQYLNTNTMLRLGGGESAFQDISTVSRTQMIVRSLQEVQQNPWIGAGIGATSEWLTMDRPHNLYLMIAVELGTLGLAVFMLLLWILWSGSNSVGRVAVILYATSCMFSHTNLSQGCILFLLAAILVFYRKGTEDRLDWKLQ